MEGTVIRAAGGFFAVRDPQGQEYLCTARGKLKQPQRSLMVGDRVIFNPGNREDGGKAGVVETVLPRANCLHRPPVANVDQMILVISLRDPAPDWQLANRLLILAEQQELSALLCLNKVDLVEPAELAELQRRLEPFPYPLLFSSVVLGEGVEQLRKRLQGRCSVLAGPSGTGKSSLLNMIQPGLLLKTGAVSDKIKRGRHTTRQAELLSLHGGGFVVDTPGFSRLDFSGLEPVQLASCFPEIEPYAGRCAFRNCRHVSEPDCAVQDASTRGEINGLRYRDYKIFYQELVDRSNDQKWR